MENSMKMKDILSYPIEKIASGKFECDCGKCHEALINNIVVEKGATDKLAEVILEAKAVKVFIIADMHTYNVAGSKILDLIKNDTPAQIKKFIYDEEFLIPDERAIGRALIEVDTDTSLIIALGSGTINDISRMISYKMKIPYIVVCTAPSMDGYASVVSPLIVDSVKNTYGAVYPHAVIGDTDILKAAPHKMIHAGLGDVLGKFTAICDWKIASLLQNEYYCQQTVDMVEGLIKRCADASEAVNKRDEKAIEDVTKALILSGIAIGFVGHSRPASGSEHLLSHSWEMYFLSNEHEEEWLHGNKVGVGTGVVLELFNYLRQLDIKQLRNINNYGNESQAEEAEEAEELLKTKIEQLYKGNSEKVISFSLKIWHKHLEEKKSRREKILDNWDKIIQIMDSTLPSIEGFKAIMAGAQMEYYPYELGIGKETFKNSIITAKDLRERYSMLQLLDDIGLLEEAADKVTNLYY